MKVSKIDVPGGARPRRFDTRSYLAAHEAFRDYSDQRRMVMEWFEQCGLLEYSSPAPSVLSVGAGSGDIDIALVEELGDRGSFSYDAVDPNRVALERFRERSESLATGDARRVWFHHGDYEQFEPGHRYDLIHFIHAIYSIPNLELAVSKSYRLLEDGGKIAIVCSTDEGMNRFKRTALAAIGREVEGTTVPEAKLLKTLSELEGTRLQLGMIPSQINVEPCLARLPLGERILSYFLQSDFADLAPAEQQTVIESLEEHCIGEPGSRALAQPMLGIVLTKESVAAGQRVGLRASNRRQQEELADIAVFA